MKKPTRKYLSDYFVGHDNNFNLVRFVAAVLVLITHSFALSTGQSDSEPLRVWLGVTWGSIAVDIFFITSGFLVAGSLLNRQNLIEFIIARALRILPGLWISLVVTTIILGCVFSNIGVANFFTDKQTYRFLLRNALILTDMAWQLPGVFITNPAHSTINGSLWSLSPEVKMYLLLAGFWFTSKFFKYQNTSFTALASGIYATLTLGVTVFFYEDGATSSFIYLSAMFFCGTTYFILKNHITMSQKIFFGLIIVLVSSAFLSRQTFILLYRFSLPYIVLYIATVSR